MCVGLWYADGHRDDIDDLVADDRADVARRRAATFDSDGTKLFDERPAGNAKVVDPVGLDRDVTRNALGVEVSGTTRTVDGR